MAGFSTGFTQAILAYVTGTAMDAPPAATYLALFDGNPTDDGSGGTEVTELVRAAGRPVIGWGSPTVGKTMANDLAVDFGEAADDASVTHAAIFTDETGGTIIATGALVTPRSITAGDPVSVLIGDLTLGLTG